MKPYFEEDDKSVIPFNQVLTAFILSNKVRVICGNNVYSNFPIDQLDDYKLWLALKQQALVNQANPGIIASGDE